MQPSRLFTLQHNELSRLHYYQQLILQLMRNDIVINNETNENYLQSKNDRAIKTNILFILRIE